MALFWWENQLVWTQKKKKKKAEKRAHDLENQDVS
jgi:hypothetical protein